MLKVKSKYANLYSAYNNLIIGVFLGAQSTTYYTFGHQVAATFDGAK